MTEDCSQACECTSTGAVCRPKTCQSGFVCTIYDFKRECYRGVCVGASAARHHLSVHAMDSATIRAIMNK